ncbi:helix-turn-helix domain-containing protein [Streptomyces bluensis]|uniref:helix-turn-helix domain-containing protein n=1 Tax=Streptomyces bluensis TaxID=33897 RepID=UPI00332A61FE
MAADVMTIRRRLLGNEMRRLREARGLSLDAAADRIVVDKSKISRMENGKGPLTKKQLHTLLDMYELRDTKLREELDRLCKDGRSRDLMQPRSSAMPPRLQELMELEEMADSIFVYEPMVVPGLLQTKEYAEAIMRHFVDGDDEVQRGVTLRMKRQEIFTREDGAPRVIFVLDEAALRRQAGSAEVQARQLHRLAEVNRPPYLTIQLIPFERGAHHGLYGTFQLFSFREAALNDLVLVEHQGGRIFFEQEAAVEPFQRAADALRAYALPSDVSMEMISEIAQRLERE